MVVANKWWEFDHLKICSDNWKIRLTWRLTGAPILEICTIIWARHGKSIDADIFSQNLRSNSGRNVYTKWERKSRNTKNVPTVELASNNQNFKSNSNQNQITLVWFWLDFDLVSGFKCNKTREFWLVLQLFLRAAPPVLIKWGFSEEWTDCRKWIAVLKDFSRWVATASFEKSCHQWETYQTKADLR